MTNLWGSFLLAGETKGARLARKIHDVIDKGLFTIPENTTPLEACLQYVAGGADLDESLLSAAVHWDGTGALPLAMLARGVPKSGKPLYTLHDAIEYSTPEVVEKLLNKGWKINARNKKGETPLLHAMHLGKRDIIILLLERHANPDIADSDGMTPLMHAADKDNRSCMMLLVEKGADPFLKNKKGESARDLSESNYMYDALAAAEAWKIHCQAQRAEKRNARFARYMSDTRLHKDVPLPAPLRPKTARRRTP